MCQRLVCQKREVAARSSYCEVSRLRIDMKHSYFSNYFIICLQSTFSVVEIIIEPLVCQSNYVYVLVHIHKYDNLLHER